MMQAWPEGRMAAFMADVEKWKNDAVYLKEVNNDFEKMFAEADSNNNGLLDLTEYKNYMKLSDAHNNKKFGGEVQTPEKFMKPGWDLCNTMTPGTNGCSR